MTEYACNYTPLCTHLKEKLSQIFHEKVLFDKDISPDYAHDELSDIEHMPEAVVLVENENDVVCAMQFAHEHVIPVTVRGSGTGLVGAAVPVFGGIVLDMTKMNKIIELDENNLSLTVEPGVLLMEISAFVEEKGFFYPPDPGEKSATIGGNIATNAGGMRAVKYGVTRDYVRALRVVLPNGNVIELGSKTVKNSSGLSLKDLIIGSEGTLGVITSATLKLLKLPSKTLSLLVPFSSLKEAMDTVPKIILSKAVPTALEFMEREVILDAEQYLGKKFPHTSAPAYLLLKFDGEREEDIERQYEDVAQICLQCGAQDVLISDTDERNESIWSSRSSFLEAIKNSTTKMDEVDCVVERSHIHEMVQYMHSLQDEVGLKIKSFGHAGDGNLHTYLLKDDLTEEDFKRRMHLAMDKIYDKAHQLKGHVSGEHGIGHAKRKYYLKNENEQVIDLMRKIKFAFDEKNILNAQKVF